MWNDYNVLPNSSKLFIIIIHLSNMDSQFPINSKYIEKYKRLVHYINIHINNVEC